MTSQYYINIGFPVFSEMKFALNALPETLINMLQVRYLINSSFPSYVYLFKK